MKRTVEAAVSKFSSGTFNWERILLGDGEKVAQVTTALCASIKKTNF
jgi:hypothetical protein